MKKKNTWQINGLLDEFKKNPKWSKSDVTEIAEKLNLTKT